MTNKNKSAPTPKMPSKIAWIHWKNFRDVLWNMMSNFTRVEYP
jgi:hypothetical protein